MSLPKGSSKIRVGGIDYHWIVSPDSGAMVVVVQLASGKGKRLREVVTYDVIVTPSVVREMILNALKEGWDPNSRGKDPRARRAKPPSRQVAVKRLPASKGSAYTCPVCSKPSLHHEKEGYFSCGGCGRTFLPSELQERFKR